MTAINIAATSTKDASYVEQEVGNLKEQRLIRAFKREPYPADLLGAFAAWTCLADSIQLVLAVVAVHGGDLS